MRGFFIGCDMATTINEFLPFADKSNANLIPYAEWVDAAKRLTGFVSGIAKSSEMNRVFAQGAQAGYAIAKFIERTLSETFMSRMESVWQISFIARLFRCPIVPRRSAAS